MPTHESNIQNSVPMRHRRFKVQLGALYLFIGLYLQHRIQRKQV